MLVFALAFGTSACGGGSSVPDGAVAVVNGTLVQQAALDEMMNRQRVVYAGQKQTFPEDGSDDFKTIQKNYVVYLVQQAELRQEAEKLGVTVSRNDVDEALARFIATNAEGKPATFRQYLKDQGFTVATFRKTLQDAVLTQKVLAAATKNVKVADDDIVAYYNANRTTKYTDTPLARVRNSIRATLVDQKRAEAKITWIQNLAIRYEDKVEYAKGFAPPGS
jgi:hypothetical protein